MDNGTEKVLVFAPEEYEARLGRLRAVMAREGVDVMLLFGQDSMFYFTGYDQIGYSVYQVLIVYADGRPCTYLTRSVDAFIVTRTS
ncbi:MAG: aminopeptidase P family N-terminal domain-containing protein, partial [Roseovarius sp.]